MKKLITTSALSLFVCIAMLSAQMKTSFTPEAPKDVTALNGLVEAGGKGTQNETDVRMPPKKRGPVQRYTKTNIFGEPIPDSFLFYRELLTDTQRNAYDEIYRALMNGYDEVQFTTRVNKFEYEDIVTAVYYDNPEIFWWAGQANWSYNSDYIITNGSFTFWLDDSEREAAQEKFKAMTDPLIFYASKLPDDMSKIKYINDYICLSTEYDYDAFNNNALGGKPQTAYSCAVEYKTVCAGYSKCFVYYMQQLGIPAVPIWGGGHEWSFIKVNDQYYQIDVCWNDDGRNNKSSYPYYFNLSHSDMQNIESHSPATLCAQIVNNHPSTSNEMSYTNYFGSLAEGSPYVYTELNNFDDDKNNARNIKIYTENPVYINMADAGRYIQPASTLISDTIAAPAVNPATNQETSFQPAVITSINQNGKTESSSKYSEYEETTKYVYISDLEDYFEVECIREASQLDALVIDFYEPETEDMLTYFYVANSGTVYDLGSSLNRGCLDKTMRKCAGRTDYEYALGISDSTDDGGYVCYLLVWFE